MARPVTPNFGWELPEPDADWGVWGVVLNYVLMQVDSILGGAINAAGGIMSGVLQFFSGSSTTPGLAVSGDPDTGFYSDEAGHIGLSVSSTPVLWAKDGEGVTIPDLQAETFSLVEDDVKQVSLSPDVIDSDNAGLEFQTRSSGTLAGRAAIAADGSLGAKTTAPRAAIDCNGGFVQSVVDLASGTAIDLRLGGFFTKTISGNTTLTFTNPASSGFQSFALRLTNGGSATITWPTSVDWGSALPPPLTASGVDTLVFYTHDGGTTYTGVLAIKDSR